MILLILFSVIFSVSFAYFERRINGGDVTLKTGIISYHIGSASLDENYQITVTPSETVSLDLTITSSHDFDTKYQLFYESENDLTNVEVGYSSDTTNLPSGNMETKGEKTVTVIIKNNGSSSITITFGVAGGLANNKVEDIILEENQHRVDQELALKSFDVQLASVKVDGQPATSLPTSGTYTLSNYTCKKGSTLKWDTYNKAITFSVGTKKGESCSLEFTTNTDYPLLINKAKQGDYVAYEGNNGCKRNGTSVTGTGEAENGNSCLGYNANANLDGTPDVNNGTYGYCYSTSYKYYIQGWRIAYIDNNRAYLISAGSLECNTRPKTNNGNTDYINLANTKALKYCNTAYVDGACDSSNAWAIGDTDFNKMTVQMTGTSGGYLYTSISGATKCGNGYSKTVCGYNSDLINIGGYYWFAAAYSSSSANGVYLNPSDRCLRSSSATSAYGLRPIIRLSSSIVITGGFGTMEDPYIILKQ